MSDTTTNGSTRPARPTRRDALRNRQLLIQSAREVFGVRGLEASMDDVAHHAGLGVGTAYRHFANKHELASAIFDNAVDEIVELGDRALRSPDAWAGLVGFVEAMLEAQTLNRALREILIGLYDDDRDRHHHRLTAPFAALLERAKAAGSIRDDVAPSDIDVIVVAMCTISDMSAGQSPYLWRRYLPMMLDALRSSTAPMPVPALTPDQLQDALRGARRRPNRVSADAPAD